MLLRILCIICLVSLAPSPVFANKQSISVVFSPNAGATTAIVKLISEAKRTIRVAAYSFTSKDIARALMDAHKSGIDVKVVLDKSNATGKYSSATFLANVGVPVRINYKYSIMHNKFIVIDDSTLETGSFNFTKAAELHNAENLIVLHNYPNIAKQYLSQWQKLWDEGKPYVVRGFNQSFIR